MVSTRPLFSKSSSPCANPLVTVPRAQIIIGITVTFMFHCLFQFPSKVLVLISLFAFFQFYSEVSRDSKVHRSTCSLFHLLLIITRSGRLAMIIIIIIIIIYSSRVLHISITWWFFTGVWVTASLLKSPGLVSVFWPFSAMLSFE